MDARLAKNMSGRNARFAGKIFKASLLTQPSRTSCGQFRFAKASSGYAVQKEPHWIRNAESCTLGKESREVMLAPMRQEELEKTKFVGAGHVILCEVCNSVYPARPRILL